MRSWPEGKVNGLRNRPAPLKRVIFLIEGCPVVPESSVKNFEVLENNFLLAIGSCMRIGHVWTCPVKLSLPNLYINKQRARRVTWFFWILIFAGVTPARAWALKIRYFGGSGRICRLPGSFTVSRRTWKSWTRGNHFPAKRNKYWLIKLGRE